MPYSKSTNEKRKTEERRNMTYGKRRKAALSSSAESSDSSSDNEESSCRNTSTPAKTSERASNTGSRSSDRIKARKNREFRLPSREDVLGKIHSSKSPSKSHSHLQPRRLVNNFTRVTHRYNYDPVYTSDESSLEDFIEDSEDEEEEEGKQEEEEDSDSGTDTLINQSTRKKKNVLPVESDEETGQAVDEDKVKRKPNKSYVIESDSSSDSEGAGPSRGSRKKRNVSVIESDSSYTDDDNIPLARLLKSSDPSPGLEAGEGNKVDGHCKVLDFETVHDEYGITQKKTSQDSDYHTPDSDEEPVVAIHSRKRNISVIVSDSSDCEDGNSGRKSMESSPGPGDQVETAGVSVIDICDKAHESTSEDVNSKLLEPLIENSSRCSTSALKSATDGNYPALDVNCNVSSEIVPFVKQEPGVSQDVSDTTPLLETSTTQTGTIPGSGLTIKPEPGWHPEETKIKTEPLSGSIIADTDSPSAFSGVDIKTENLTVEPSGTLDRGQTVKCETEVSPGTSSATSCLQRAVKPEPDIVVVNESCSLASKLTSSSGSESISGSGSETDSSESSSDEDEDLVTARMRHLASRSKKMKNQKDQWLQKFEELRQKRAKMAKHSVNKQA